MSEYTEKAENFLKAHGLEFRSVLVGDDCPKFCADAQAGRDMDKVNTFPRKTHIHGKHYRCTISGAERGHVSFDFWNSYADEEWNWTYSNRFEAKGKFVNRQFGYGQETMYERYKSNFAKGRKKETPTAYDLLACIEKNEPGTFTDFCSDFGYDTDSRRAFDVYQAVQEEYSKIRRFFTAAEIEELQEVQ